MSQILLQLKKLFFILELSMFTSLLPPLQRLRPRSHTAINPFGNHQIEQGDVWFALTSTFHYMGCFVPGESISPLQMV